MRIALARTHESTYRFFWTTHHILLDGWSTSHVMSEAAAYYRSFLTGTNLVLSKPRAFKDYIAWLQKRDKSLSQSFWRNYLAGFHDPNTIPEISTTHERSTDNITAHSERRYHLSRDTTRELQSFARENHLTLNTVILGIWTLLLSQYSGRGDVVTGVTASGRPRRPRWRGIHGGMFINTLPLRATVSHDSSIVQWLHELQKSLSSVLQHQFCSLSDIQKWSDLSPGQSLFEYIYVFENYPIQDSLSNNDGRLQISDVRSIQETNYPLGVVILPGRRIVRDVSSRPHPLRRVRHHPLFYALLSSFGFVAASGVGCACRRSVRVAGLGICGGCGVVECFGASVSPGGFAGGVVRASSCGVSGWRCGGGWRGAGDVPGAGRDVGPGGRGVARGGRWPRKPGGNPHGARRKIDREFAGDFKSGRRLRSVRRLLSAGTRRMDD